MTISFFVVSEIYETCGTYFSMHRYLLRSVLNLYRAPTKILPDYGFEKIPHVYYTITVSYL